MAVQTFTRPVLLYSSERSAAQQKISDGKPVTSLQRLRAIPQTAWARYSDRDDLEGCQ